MPKTTYRFRVAPLLVSENEEKRGEWSEVESIQTTDT